MRVTCPKCDATIDITVTDLRPTSFRWRTNDFPLIEGLCRPVSFNASTAWPNWSLSEP